MLSKKHNFAQDKWQITPVSNIGNQAMATICCTWLSADTTLSSTEVQCKANEMIFLVKHGQQLPEKH